MRINKKYKTRHLILSTLFGKLKYNDIHSFNLHDSATSVEQLATELNTTVEEILKAHHGLTKHIECDCLSGKHIITLNDDGIDAFIDEYWIREGQKDLNDKFYDRIKWIAPIAALIVTITALGYNAYKTDSALKKVSLLEIEIGRIKNESTAFNDTIKNKAANEIIKRDTLQSKIQKITRQH